MSGRNERNCQIRMPASLWNLIGEIGQELGFKDSRGRHSAVIREMIAAVAAKWVHSPYVCRSARHTVYVTKEGTIFSRHVQTLRLNSPREKLPCFIEMKPEKREYYHRKYREVKSQDKAEHDWFLNQWLLNYFAAWSGKKNSEDIESFSQVPLSFHTDTFGTTYKSADLAVHAIGGRFLTREIVVGLRDYVQWKEPNTPVFDRIDIPIDIPTSDLEICVIVDRDLFSSMSIDEEEIANLALEFRNRESARFEGKEVVALYPEIGLQEQSGRSEDEGADEMLRRVRRLRERVRAITESTSKAGQPLDDFNREAINSSFLELPKKFLFYWLKWASPHLGIETCIRWEKPVSPYESTEKMPTGSKASLSGNSREQDSESHPERGHRRRRNPTR